MGIAFFDKGKLIYYGVKTIKKGKSPSETLKEGRKVILRLIKDLKPNILVVEKVFFANNRSASLLNVFVDEIKAIGRRKGLEVKGFAPSTVKKAICGYGRASKKEVAKVIVSYEPVQGIDTLFLFDYYRDMIRGAKGFSNNRENRELLRLERKTAIWPEK